jgi:hypothetical protein
MVQQYATEKLGQKLVLEFKFILKLKPKLSEQLQKNRL